VPRFCFRYKNIKYKADYINSDFSDVLIHTSTDKIFNRQFSRKFRTNIQRVVLRKLRMLNKAIMLQDLKLPPGNKL
jgi:plasmid maintenance system killer protein